MASRAALGDVDASTIDEKLMENIKSKVVIKNEILLNDFIYISF